MRRRSSQLNDEESNLKSELYVISFIVFNDTKLIHVHYNLLLKRV